MNNRFLDFTRPRAGHHFQADRYSYRERAQRRASAPFRRLFAWANSRDPDERNWRVFLIAAGFIASVLVGVLAMLFFGAAWVLATST